MKSKWSGALRARISDIRAVLLYGPDSGLIHERALALVGWVAGSAHDPFLVSELNASTLKTDPARLLDELAAHSMIGGRRVVWVQEAQDSAALLEQIERPMATSTLLVIEAGDLPTRSSLRKGAEAAPHALAIACYHDNHADLEQVITESLAHFRQTIAPDARAYLIDRLGNDRLISRSELAKLTLLVGPNGEITRAHVAQSTGDNVELSLMTIVWALSAGTPAALARALDRAWADGESAVGVARMVIRHFQRLHRVVGAIASGQPPEQAIAGLRPAPFKRDADLMARHVRLWTPSSLSLSLQELTRAELLCKTTGVPDQTALAQALFAISRRARPPRPPASRHDR